MKSKSVVARSLRDWGGQGGVTINEYEVSFWGDKMKMSWN